jgi:hypothetical protein
MDRYLLLGSKSGMICLIASETPATYDEIIYTWEGYQAREPTWRRLLYEEVEILLGS